MKREIGAGSPVSEEARRRPGCPTAVRPPGQPGRSTAADGRAGLTLPDRLTGFRLASVPILWIVALLLHNPVWLGIGIGVAAFTDVIDGPIARRSHRTTARGSRVDSIADSLLAASTGLWLVWLRPSFVAEQLPLLTAWMVLAVTALLVGWVRFRRIGNLHLYSAKLAGAFGYVFAIWLFLFGTYSTAVFYVVIASLVVASGEGLLVVSTAATVDEHVGSILLSSRRRTTRAEPVTRGKRRPEE